MKDRVFNIVFGGMYYGAVALICVCILFTTGALFNNAFGAPDERSPNESLEFCQASVEMKDWPVDKIVQFYLDAGVVTNVQEVTREKTLCENLLRNLS